VLDSGQFAITVEGIDTIQAEQLAVPHDRLLEEGPGREPQAAEPPGSEPVQDPAEPAGAPQPAEAEAERPRPVWDRTDPPR
jgi:hypothetical protein